MRKASLPILLFALAAAGVAHAEVQSAPRLVLSPPRAEPADAAALNAAVLAPDRQVHELPQPGVARTAIDRRFEKSRATGSIGFLCGRPDSLDERAASQPLGSDPQGRFLGARLSFAFR